MHISITRADLLARLDENLARAKRDDALALAKHKKDEQAALRRFRGVLREALKWDYAKVKKRQFEASLGYSERPSCPASEAARIERAIREVNFDRREKFTVPPNTDLHWALTWVPREERPAPAMC